MMLLGWLALWHFHPIEKRDDTGLYATLAIAVCWPLFELLGKRNRAIAVRRYNDQVIDFRTRSPLYAEILRQENTKEFGAH